MQVPKQKQRLNACMNKMSTDRHSPTSLLPLLYILQSEAAHLEGDRSCEAPLIFLKLARSWGLEMDVYLQVTS